ncbi:serine protease inhibitor swm-1-like [Cylas formicarius]|uniref:serine protease inhibitor swm-1-like n=1 Tax=Cylas formicarius TaxID=197179 RepID=UPI002958C620|nr:serine protease inhibitor swm-1-like [Cylas formicarius]
MSKSLNVALWFVFIWQIATSQFCNENEVRDFCGTACEETCWFRAENCIAVCVDGCFCKDGYVRLSFDNNTCVARSDCPPKPPRQCNENQSEQCLNPYCVYTCAGKPDDCIEMPSTICTTGCYCSEGFVRHNATGPCVAISECDN